MRFRFDSDNPRDIAKNWLYRSNGEFGTVPSLTKMFCSMASAPKLILSRDYIEIFPDDPLLRVPRRCLSEGVRLALSNFEESHRGKITSLPNGDYAFEPFDVEIEIDFGAWIEAVVGMLIDDAGPYVVEIREGCRCALENVLVRIPHPPPAVDVDALRERHVEAVRRDELRWNASHRREEETRPAFFGTSKKTPRIENKTFLHGIPKPDFVRDYRGPTRFGVSDIVETDIEEAMKSNRIRDRLISVHRDVRRIVDKISVRNQSDGR